ncbi:hypothetical protein [Spirosoma utsteinense]|uniref:SMODS and SLOG-associating 2TM effector domain-containing protein n=1 Tax=Spirosoma utsteinense TaxID=2585773 RepID=A0ABR6WFI6_9BACT|nr:hypothetical protein [Spirosoma utsteinense]MBC3795034.1 hypothetical protein [Spirosoma utsteinense]
MKSDYDRVTEIGTYKTRILYLSTAITFLLTLNNKYEFSKSYKGSDDYIELAIGFNSILVVLYILLEIRENYIFSKAERNRTLQYVDNSFETNFAGKRVDNYFTQDKLNPGFYKLSVNCFENTYHSFNIAKQMQFAVYSKAVIVLLVFMFSATVGDKGIVRYLTEAVLPLSLIQNAVKLSIFVTRLDSLKETFTTFFTSMKNVNFENREPEALKNVITYETTLAWASMPLDSDIFFKMQEQLAQEWEELKKEFQIK